MFSTDDSNAAISGHGNTVKVDLSDYTKVGHQHRIIDVSDLEQQLASKATTNHTHDIAHIKNLRTELNGKSDTGHTHDIRTITNYEKIDKLEDVTVKTASLGQSLDTKLYTFNVDDQGCLNIWYNTTTRIAQYLPTTSDWIFHNLSISEIDETLENHYLAITKIKEVLKEANIISSSESQQ